MFCCFVVVVDVDLVAWLLLGCCWAVGAVTSVAVCVVFVAFVFVVVVVSGKSGPHHGQRGDSHPKLCFDNDVTFCSRSGLLACFEGGALIKRPGTLVFFFRC